MAIINEYLNTSAAKINIPTPFILKGQAPLDLRQIVQKAEDLVIENFYDGDAPFWYPGMLVSCVENSKVYILKEEITKDETTGGEIKNYVFVEVSPDLPEYALSSVKNESKGEVQFTINDDTSNSDKIYIEGGGNNIKVSSDVSGVKVEHTVPTEGAALTTDETVKDPGYAGTFTAITGLTKDANGHIVAATLETIKIPGEQTIPTETFTGVQIDGTDLKITNTKVNWGLNYNSSNKHIEVVDRNDNDEVIDFIDASNFIKDGMLSSGELVWCTIAADGKHTEVAEGTTGAIHCLKLTLRVWEQGLVDENNQPIYTEQYVHIPLGELCDPYAGTDGEIVVEEEHGKHAISLADKTVSETTGTVLTPAHGGSFNVVTDVTYDTKGRIAGVETTQVALPTIDNGIQTDTDEYVTVGVETTAGVVSKVTVNTDTLTTKLTDIQKEIDDNEYVTAAALNDLNSRLVNLKTGVSSISGDDADYVNVSAAAADDKGNVVLTVTVDKVEATDKTKYASTGLATDGYVKEQVATVAATADTAVQNIASKDSTIKVTCGENSNDVNIELVWASF